MDFGTKKTGKKAGKSSQGKATRPHLEGSSLEFQRDLQDFPKSLEKDVSIQDFFGISHGTVSQLP